MVTRRPTELLDRESLLGKAQLDGDDELVSRITRGMRRADVDLASMLKWQRDGFVSVPGNLGPVTDDEGE